MPLKKCGSDGKSGWKWGDSGKCYTGPDGKKKAIKQGVAIEGPEKFSQKASNKEFELTQAEYDYVDEGLESIGLGLGDRIAYALNFKRFLNE